MIKMLDELKDEVLKSRSLRFNTRWINSPRIKDNNVAEHSYYVMLYSSIFWKLEYNTPLQVDVIAISLLHDISESISGDIPQNVKRINKAASEEIEQKCNNEFKLINSMFNIDTSTNEVYNIVKLADLFDAYITCVEEYNMGNKFFYAALTELSTTIKTFLVEKRYSNNIINFIEQFTISDCVKIDIENGTHIHKGYKI